MRLNRSAIKNAMVKAMPSVIQTIIAVLLSSDKIILIGTMLRMYKLLFIKKLNFTKLHK